MLYMSQLCSVDCTGPRTALIYTPRIHWHYINSYTHGHPCRHDSSHFLIAAFSLTKRIQFSRLPCLGCAIISNLIYNIFIFHETTSAHRFCKLKNKCATLINCTWSLLAEWERNINTHCTTWDTICRHFHLPNDREATREYSEQSECFWLT